MEKELYLKDLLAKLKAEGHQVVTCTAEEISRMPIVGLGPKDRCVFVIVKLED